MGGKRSVIRGGLALLAAAVPMQGALSKGAGEAQLRAIETQLVQLETEQDLMLAIALNANSVKAGAWPDRTLKGVQGFERRSDDLLKRLKSIRAETLESSRQDVQVAIIERLEGVRGARVCRFNLWDVNHMSGWHLSLEPIARQLPLSTKRQEHESLKLWRAFPSMVDQEIANARTGLSRGYSSPKSVVRKVLKQVDGLIGSTDSPSPLQSISTRLQSPEGKRRADLTLKGAVMPALIKYRAFLQNEYLPKARETLGIVGNPDGAACYQAALRVSTTLDRPAEAVFQLGQTTVEGNKARVIDLGRAKFGTDNLGEIVKRIAASDDNHFASEKALVDFSRETVSRAKLASARLFKSLPVQEMITEPFPDYRRGSGGSSYYEANPDPSKPAHFFLDSENWKDETRGSAEITAAHEGFPGHHMQLAPATATTKSPSAPLTRNPAYIEGWARYSEMLAEEAGIYRTAYAPMTRLLWPARGMVVDVGIHLKGWSREQAIQFMQESGRFTAADDDDTVDRIAVWPGQLTACDSGALEILALRREAERALGERFDLPAFHEVVLGRGEVPLCRLRENVRRWIVAQRPDRTGGNASFPHREGCS